MRGDYAEAYRMLDAHRPHVTRDEPILEALADIAWQLQEEAGAERALNVLVASTRRARRFSRLIAL